VPGSREAPPRSCGAGQSTFAPAAVGAGWQKPGAAHGGARVRWGGEQRGPDRDSRGQGTGEGPGCVGAPGQTRERRWRGHGGRRMREAVSAANVGLASRRRVKARMTPRGRTELPPNGRGGRGVGFTGSEDGRGPLVGEGPGERRPRGTPAECRAPMKGSSADGGVERRPKIDAGVGAGTCARSSARKRTRWEGLQAGRRKAAHPLIKLCALDRR
jgi:hypothetical protein